MPIPTFYHMGKNIVLVYSCTALIICEINTCNVPTYEEFNVIISMVT